MQVNHRLSQQTSERTHPFHITRYINKPESHESRKQFINRFIYSNSLLHSFYCGNVTFAIQLIAHCSLVRRIINTSKPNTEILETSKIGILFTFGFPLSKFSHGMAPIHLFKRFEFICCLQFVNRNGFQYFDKEIMNTY